MGIRGRQIFSGITASAKQISSHHWHTPNRNFHMAFKILYLYDFFTQLCRDQEIVILNHENVNIRTIGQGEAHHRKYKRLESWWRSGIRSVTCLDGGYNLDHV
jgi:hypothetical protein